MLFLWQPGLIFRYPPIACLDWWFGFGFEPLVLGDNGKLSLTTKPLGSKPPLEKILQSFRSKTPQESHYRPDVVLWAVLCRRVSAEDSISTFYCQTKGLPVLLCTLGVPSKLPLKPSTRSLSAGGQTSLAHATSPNQVIPGSFPKAARDCRGQAAFDSVGLSRPKIPCGYSHVQFFTGFACATRL